MISWHESKGNACGCGSHRPHHDGEDEDEQVVPSALRRLSHPWLLFGAAPLGQFAKKGLIRSCVEAWKQRDSTRGTAFS